MVMVVADQPTNQISVFKAMQQLLLQNLRHFFVLNTQHVNKYGDFHCR